MSGNRIVEIASEQGLAPIALAKIIPIPDGTGRYRVSFGLGEGFRLEGFVIAKSMTHAEQVARQTIRRCWPQWKEMI